MLACRVLHIAATCTSLGGLFYARPPRDAGAAARRHARAARVLVGAEHPAAAWRSSWVRPSWERSWKPRP